MILLPHIVTGGVIGAKTKNLGLIVILGFLSHFILDRIPHWDYALPGIRSFSATGNINALIIDVLKILLDIALGLLIIFLITRRKKALSREYLPYMFLGILASVLPDIPWILSSFIDSDILNNCISFHNKFHFITEKEGAITFLGFFAQIAVIIFALIASFV